MRVMNDDYVQPDRGFGTHGHNDMEIITYVARGKLTHKDSMGTEETLGRGSVQFMTAGRGVRHSEYNLKRFRTEIHTDLGHPPGEWLGSKLWLV